MKNEITAEKIKYDRSVLRVKKETIKIIVKKKYIINEINFADPSSVL